MEVTRGHQQSSTVSIEIPVWYGGAEKWITGIHRRTTCDDVVKALLGSSDPSKDQGGYVLVERWRKVERALDSKSRIMKLWNKWGDEQCNVKLSLKRIHQSVPQLKVYSESKENKENTTRHRRCHRGQGSKNTSSGQSSKSWHPKKLEDARDMSNTMDKLIKLIMSQTETISFQLTRLLDKDKQIEQYETQIHELRMSQIGTNYVQDAYLQEGQQNGDGKQEDDVKKDDDGDDPMVEAAYREVLDLMVRLEKEENTIVTLEAELKQGREEEEVDRLKGELERLEAVYTSRQNVLAQNDRFIFDSERTVREKQDLIDRLEVQILDADKETDRLHGQYQALCESADPKDVESAPTNIVDEETSVENTATDFSINRNSASEGKPSENWSTSIFCVEQKSSTEYMNQRNYDVELSQNQEYPSPVNSSPVNCKGETESIDSDTGLSSLHSSSDETAYVLDTLV